MTGTLVIPAGGAEVEQHHVQTIEGSAPSTELPVDLTVSVDRGTVDLTTWEQDTYRFEIYRTVRDDHGTRISDHEVRVEHSVTSDGSGTSIELHVEWSGHADVRYDASMDEPRFGVIARVPDQLPYRSVEVNSPACDETAPDNVLSPDDCGAVNPNVCLLCQPRQDTTGIPARVESFEADRMTVAARAAAHVELSDLDVEDRLRIDGGQADVKASAVEAGSLDFTSVGGSLHLVGTVGSLDATSSFGDVFVLGDIPGEVSTDLSHGTAAFQGELGRLQAVSSHGDVRVEGAIHGPVDAESSHGSIHLDGPIDGAVEADTSHGNIHVESDASGPVEMESGFGSLTYLGDTSTLVAENSHGQVQAEGTIAHVDADTSHGAIHVGGSIGEVDAASSWGAISVQGDVADTASLRTGGPIDFDGTADELQAHGGDRNVTITVPDDPDQGYNATLDTENGTLVVDLVDVIVEKSENGTHAEVRSVDLEDHPERMRIESTVDHASIILRHP